VSLKKGYVRLTTLFIDDSELHVFEYVNSDLRKLSYAYHYQNPSGSLIFRYDNEPHYPALPTFPHHKHIDEEKTPKASEEVNIDEVLKEISLHISKTRKKLANQRKQDNKTPNKRNTQFHNHREAWTVQTHSQTFHTPKPQKITEQISKFVNW